MSVENKQVRGDASVSRNASMGGNARVQGSVHIGHNLRVDGWIEGKDIKAANKGLFISESELNRAYPNPQDGWFAGVGETSPFTVYIANGGVWQRTNGTFAVDVDMSRYNGRIDELESQVESNNALIAELIEIIREGGGSADLVMITIENDNPTWGSVSGGGLKRKGSVTLTATAESGYHFVEWQDAEGVQLSTDAEYTFETTESVTLKAVFAVSYYTVSATPNDSDLGRVTLVADNEETQDGYIHGTQITLTATPKDNHIPTAYFVAWKENGVVVSRNAEYHFGLTKNVALVAEFAEVAVIDRSIDSGSTGTGTIDATVTRGGVDVAETDVRIGDHVLITLTGTSKKPNSLTVGGVEVQCTPAQNGKVWTYEFDYSGSESLTFRATFSGDAVIVSRTVSVNVKNEQSSWGSAEIVFDGESKSSVTVAENTDVLLRATANNGYAFAHWKKGVETLDWTAEKTLGVTESTAGTYTAEFEHNTAPDFYFGVFDTPQNNPVLDNINDDAGLTKGWLADNAKAQITLPTGKTFVVLYRSSVVPTACKITDDIGPGTLDLDSQQSFYATTKTLNNVTYTAREFYGGNTGSGNWSVEITFAANSNSQE